MTNPADAIRTAVQALLDAEGDGYQLGQIVIAMGLERVGPDGTIEAIPWCWAPNHQPDWQTEGLLESAIDLRRSYIDED